MGSFESSAQLSVHYCAVHTLPKAILGVALQWMVFCYGSSMHGGLLGVGAKAMGLEIHMLFIVFF